MTGYRALRRTFRTVLALGLLSPLAAAPAFADKRADSKAAFERGLGLLDKGDVRAARIESMKALQANPSSAMARVLSARVFLEIGNGVAAQTELEKATAAGFPREKVRHLLAHALLLQNQLPKALKEADPALVPDQFASYAARMRGRVQVAQQQPDRAKGEFELAVSLAPDSPDALVDLGRYKMLAEDPTGGRPEVDRALELEPTNIRALLLKGDMVRATDGLEKSIPVFTQALQVDPNNVEALLERAGTLGDLRREAEARADLKKVLGLIPDHPLALYLEAVLESRSGRYAKANALMTRTKGMLNSYAPALMLQGMLAYQLGNIQQADDFLGKVVAQVPTSELARKLHAAVQLRKGDAQSVINTLKPIIDSNRADARTMALLGSAYARQGKFAESQKALEAAAAAAPKEPALKTQLAMTRVAQGDNAGATAMLAQILKADPKSMQALMMVSLVNMRQSKYKEAAASAEQIIKNYPNQPIGYNLRGAAQLGMNDNKSAEASFRAALAKKPDFAEARRNLAQVLIATGRPAEGRKQLLQVLTTNRSDTAAMAALAEVARVRGAPNERINWLKQAVGTQPKAIGPRIALTQAYLQNNQMNKALVEAAALEREFPENPTVIELSGVTFLSARQPAKAESAFNRLVTAAPGDAGPRILLARTQALQNRIDDARKTYQQALTLTGQQDVIPVYVDLVALEARNNNMPGAMALLGKMRTLYPKLNIADQVLGDLRLNAGDAAGAVAAYQAARKVKFDQSTAMRLSAAYIRLKQPQSALDTLGAFSKANPRDRLAQAGIADINIQLGRHKEAIAIYEKLRREGARTDSSIANNLAWSYHQLGDKRAVPTAMEALRLAPRNAAIIDTTGIVLVETKTDVKKGLVLLQSAARLSPRDPNIRYHLAVAFRANDKDADALRELNLALKAPRFENRAKAVQLAAKLRG